MAKPSKLEFPGSRQAVEQMKYEIANEFGVTLDANNTSRSNGSVGGEITKRLVEMAQSRLSGSNNE